MQSHLQGMQFCIYRVCEVTCRVCALAGYAEKTWSKSRTSHLQGMRTYRVCAICTWSKSRQSHLQGMRTCRVCSLDLVEITAKSLAGYAHLQGMRAGLGRNHREVTCRVCEAIYRVCEVTCRVCALAGYAEKTWSKSRTSHLQGMLTYRVCDFAFT